MFKSTTHPTCHHTAKSSSKHINSLPPYQLVHRRNSAEQKLTFCALSRAINLLLYETIRDSLLTHLCQWTWESSNFVASMCLGWNYNGLMYKMQHLLLLLWEMEKWLQVDWLYRLIHAVGFVGVLIIITWWLQKCIYILIVTRLEEF